VSPTGRPRLSGDGPVRLCEPRMPGRASLRGLGPKGIRCGGRPSAATGSCQCAHWPGSELRRRITTTLAGRGRVADDAPSSRPAAFVRSFVRSSVRPPALCLQILKPAASPRAGGRSWVGDPQRTVPASSWARRPPDLARQRELKSHKEFSTTPEATVRVTPVANDGPIQTDHNMEQGRPGMNAQ
jgi:hypothetical protein